MGSNSNGKAGIGAMNESVVYPTNILFTVNKPYLSTSTGNQSIGNFTDDHSNTQGGNPILIIATVVAAGGFLLLLFIALILFLVIRRRKRHQEEEMEDVELTIYQQIPGSHYCSLAPSLVLGINPDNLKVLKILGSGAFGTIYSDLL
jgi:hypothetical protein